MFEFLEKYGCYVCLAVNVVLFFVTWIRGGKLPLSTKSVKTLVDALSPLLSVIVSREAKSSNNSSSEEVKSNELLEELKKMLEEVNTNG
ncbi:MAG: hypothetical protein [Chaetfec virus UA24_2268]|nr:MAG: hypothetical protein [Chaetfec virus UA24_2268]